MEKVSSEIRDELIGLTSHFSHEDGSSVFGCKDCLIGINESVDKILTAIRERLPKDMKPLKFLSNGDPRAEGWNECRKAMMEVLE